MSSTHFPFAQPISEEIWNMKYRFQTDREGFYPDENVVNTWSRIAQVCADVHPENPDLYKQFYTALSDFKFLPAGRIIAGAGTGRNVTLFNCYVMGTIPDSLNGIFDMLKEAALTMQQGGGIGYDFSTLRPKGAPVKGVESFSSGPLTFMDVWDAMCKTIMSAGHRRGAMMATMRCDHPDIEEFIKAKGDSTRLRHFNVSVLCTDEFIEAVINNDTWFLNFEGTIYKQIDARYLWNLIMENTYAHAEPGVIFIDQINRMNNLWFLEDIAATNPCGEQPLPPYGACLLGSINLPKFVLNPFMPERYLDWQSMEQTVRSAVRMLDCVIDISNFPLPAQRDEARYKRRMGLGITGLADMLFMTGFKYGSAEAVTMTENILNHIAEWAYDESVEMAKEWGCAPFFLSDPKNFEKFSQSKFIQNTLNVATQGKIAKYGTRNSHLLSIAPTGTISMYAGNVSSGIEPIFAPSYNRKITNVDGSKTEQTVYSYAVNEYLYVHNKSEDDAWWKAYMKTAQDLTPREHLNMQAAAQKYIDSSISKTINLPEDISFEDFAEVYMIAYREGCKGCTTYRPNDVTGSILSVETKEEKPVEQPDIKPDMRQFKRPEVLTGDTYKIKWGQDAYYITFNYSSANSVLGLAPVEIFINSKNAEHQAWIAALTRMISAVFQRGGNIDFVADEMMNVHDPKGGQWFDGQFYPSLVALIGKTMKDFIESLELPKYGEADEATEIAESDLTLPEIFESVVDSTMGMPPDQCPECKNYTMYYMNGCSTCQSCGYSKCG